MLFDYDAILSKMKNAPLDFTEIHKLDDMLTEAGLPHTLEKTDEWIDEGYQICLFADSEMTKKLDDAVIHRYSHGAEKGPA